MPRSSRGDKLALSLSRRSSAVLLLGFSLQALPPAAALAAPSWSLQAKVIRVIDGDTLEVVLDGRLRALDLEEIETPALHEDLGSEARKLTSELVLGETVRVEVRGRGAEGRWPAVVVLPDGRRLDHELVRRGLARWRGWCRERGDPELGHLEDDARKAERGIWSQPGAASLDTCREQSAPLEHAPPVEAAPEASLAPRASTSLRDPVPPGADPRDCIPRSRCCRVCTIGTACGDSCINQCYNCHKGRGCACNASEVCR